MPIVGLNMQAVMEGLIRDFLPKAGEMLQLRAKAKVGVYQPGWSRLAPMTLRNKTSRRMAQRIGMLRAGGVKTNDVLHPADMGDRPLLDTGRMLRSIQHFETHGETHLWAEHPMQEHEQDPQVGAFALDPDQNLPARPVMWPTMEEMIDPITDQLMDHIAQRF